MVTVGQAFCSVHISVISDWETKDCRGKSFILVGEFGSALLFRVQVHFPTSVKAWT